ncbi:efflux transporter outer membrane subunit [Sandaracinobacter neustonicus]|uniref:Efflux transporter outer membrane subunit n=1 Tax=Sandaracinobacter neustonicus TaxID=1715348 RepID=A0A501XL84_9SPHN|nr:efflux transporter outer membrane subunit [Sandaracinobacter neustonicus]TPE61205.1 efflux transporter outer membrane subunit [Sandaracinobacter neustonicus]
MLRFVGQRPLLAGLLLVSVAGCAAGPDYTPPASVDLGVPARFSAGAEAGPGEAELANWWSRFDDPQLNALVERAIAANPDIGQAEARLRQAREASVQAGSALLPTLDASGRGGRNFASRGGNSNSFSLGLDAGWQLDLFGGTRRGMEAARADEAAKRYDLAAVRVAIISELVSNYVQLRLAQEQLRIAEATVANQRDNRQIAGWRVQAGLVSSLDEQQARTQLAQTEATIPAIEVSLHNALNRIAVLTGQAPGEAVRALEAAAALPQPAEGLVSAGIPAEALRQRPDVRAAERSLAAATARVGVAEAQLLPALGISGSVGTSALTAGGLFDIITGSLFAGLSQTIFEGGARTSRIRGQKAAVDGAFAAYRSTVLAALEDVENALVAAKAADARTAQLAEAADAANNSAILARMQYQSGLTDFQTLLTAEQSLLSASNSLAGSRADRALAVVQLYNALGGGWQTMDGRDT